METGTVIAIASIYGVDLLMDNVETCRNRLLQIWLNEYQTICKKEINEECIEAVKFILERNIQCGNALTLMRVDENGNDTDEYIVFSEWSFVMGNKMQRKDYRFDKLLAGEYEPTASAKKKKRRKTHIDEGQMSFTDLLDEKPNEEGELLTSYVADYRRIQEYGK